MIRLDKDNSVALMNIVTTNIYNIENFVFVLFSVNKYAALLLYL